MAQTRNKLPGYLETALKEASRIIYQAKDKTPKDKP
jgi:hypothetical protein